MVRVMLRCVVVTLAIGCGGNERAPDESPEPAAEVKAKIQASPLEGPLTVERLITAKGGVKPYDHWGRAWAHLVATAGEPTASEGDAFRWTVLAGEVCYLLEVRRDGERVDSVMYGPYEKGTSQFGRCEP
jgi:hypothetical protein